MTKKQDTPEDVQFLKPREIATRLRVAPMSVYRMIHSGELPAIRVGKSYRVPVAAYEEYVKGCAVQAGDADA